MIEDALTFDHSKIKAPLIVFLVICSFELWEFAGTYFREETFKVRSGNMRLTLFVHPVYKVFVTVVLLRLVGDSAACRTLEGLWEEHLSSRCRRSPLKEVTQTQGKKRLLSDPSEGLGHKRPTKSLPSVAACSTSRTIPVQLASHSHWNQLCLIPGLPLLRVSFSRPSVKTFPPLLF